MSPELKAKFAGQTLLALQIVGPDNGVLGHVFQLGIPVNVVVHLDGEEPFETPTLRLSAEDAIRLAMRVADVAAPLDR